MVIVEASTGKKHQVKISLVDSVDYKVLSKERYFFDWKKEQSFEVYKLCIVDSS